MAARISCWWLQPWQKLDLEWQEGCNRGQQQLAKASDSVQKTTWVFCAVRGGQIVHVYVAEVLTRPALHALHFLDTSRGTIGDRWPNADN